jgi:hypothetical protein
MTSALNPPTHALVFDGRGGDIATAEIGPVFAAGTTGLSISFWLRSHGVSAGSFGFPLTMNTPSMDLWFRPFHYGTESISGLIHAMFDQLFNVVENDGPGVLSNRTARGAIDLHEWHHFAMSWDILSGVMTSYVDGILVDNRTVHVGYNVTDSTSGGVRMNLGVYGQGNSHLPRASFRGAIGLMQLWTSALSHDEVLADALNDTASYRSPQLLYQFDEGSGSVAANTGTAGFLYNLHVGLYPSGSNVFQVANRIHQSTRPVWLPANTSHLTDLRPRVALPLPECTWFRELTCTTSMFSATTVEDISQFVLLVGESDLGVPTQAIITRPPDSSAGSLYQTICCFDASIMLGSALSAGDVVTSVDSAVVFMPAPGVSGVVGNFSFHVRDPAGRNSSEATVQLQVLSSPDHTQVLHRRNTSVEVCGTV